MACYRYYRNDANFYFEITFALTPEEKSAIRKEPAGRGYEDKEFSRATNKRRSKTIKYHLCLLFSFPNFNAKLLKTNSPTTYFSVVAMFYRKYADSSSESVVLAAELMPVVTGFLGFCVSHQ